MIKIYVLSILLFFSVLSAKVRLLTFQYNRPDLLEMQIEALKKLMKDDYELIVFNDAFDGTMEEVIRKICERNDVQCVRYEQQWHVNHPISLKVFEQLNDPKSMGSYLGIYINSSLQSVEGCPSIRHSHVIQYALDNYGYSHDDIVAILDGDLFPIRPVSLRELFKGKDLIGTYKSKGAAKYLWVPFVAMDMRTLPNKYDLKFHPDMIKNDLYDTGAHSHYYLKENPKVGIKKYIFYSRGNAFVSLKKLEEYGFNENQIRNIIHIMESTDMEFHADFHFLHLVSSSWGEINKDKFNCIANFVKSVLDTNGL